MQIVNGGYSVTIGSYTLQHIGGYNPSWQKVYDTQTFFPNLFQTYSKMSENFVTNTSGSNMEFKINSYE